jgi:hypothetical protein
MKYADRPIDPLLIDLGKRDQDYLLYYDDLPLKTSGGHDYNHGSDRLLRLILLEALENQCIRLEGVSLALFFELQKDVIDHGRDLVQKNIDALMEADPFIAMKVSGKGLQNLLANGEEKGSVPSADSSLISVFWSVTSLLNPLNEQISRMLGRMEIHDTVDDPILHLIRSAYAERSRAEKAVLQVLCLVHRAGIVLPLLWVMGNINVSEYTRGLVAIRSKGLLPQMKEIADAEGTPFAGNGFRRHDLLDVGPEALRNDLSLAADYLDVLKTAGQSQRDLRSLVSAGESNTLEFKSTLRWDLRAGKTNPAIERASLKTISAFLNTDGGILLIGIRDDGSVEGIESDKLANEDKFLLHFWTLIRTCFGREVSPYIRADLQTEDNKTVCLVTCSRCDYPVFLNQPGFPEEFYIRTGPGSNALSVSEALKYIADRFPVTS